MQAHAADVAHGIADVSDVAVAVERFLALPPRARAEVFPHLPPAHQLRLAGSLEDADLERLLGDLPAEARAALVADVPDDERGRFLAVVPPDARGDLERRLALPETAGAIMSGEFVAVPGDITADDALARLRQGAPTREAAQALFVTGAGGVLAGEVHLLDLFTARPDSRVRDLMRDVPSVGVRVDREEAARVVAKYDVTALPVVDAEGRVLGVITEEAALDVLDVEQNEDVQLASGIDPGPIDTTYTDATFRLLVRKRIVWLLGLLVAALLSASVIAAFEEMLAAAVALAFFIPVVTGTGGNTGTQSATLIIRALATGDVSPGDWARVFLKELAVGATLGAFLAAAIYGIGLVWPGTAAIAPVVALTMIALVIWANLVGALLPMLLRRLGADPAVAGAPLVSTVVDASGLLLYFAAARLLLG